MKINIVLLPGDGIGPEVVGAAASLLQLVAEKNGHQFEMKEYPIGGCAIDGYQNPLPEHTLKACLDADAVLLGAVGGPKWDDPTAKVRPEQGLLGLRKQLDLFANLRPIQPHPDLLASSPLRPERLEGADFIVVRELTSGIYFGQPRERRQVDGQTQAVDTMSYTTDEIERVAHMAFKLAGQRKKKLTSVDKANVLERIAKLTGPVDQPLRVERVRLSKIYKGKIDSEESVEKVVEALREHLMKLLQEKASIILE